SQCLSCFAPSARECFTGLRRSTAPLSTYTSAASASSSPWARSAWGRCTPLLPPMLQIASCVSIDCCVAWPGRGAVFALISGEHFYKLRLTVTHHNEGYDAWIKQELNPTVENGGG